MCLSSSAPSLPSADALNATAMGMDCRSSQSSSFFKISGLHERAELNGSAAEIVDNVPDASGRVIVRLTSTPTGSASRKLMRVKSDCLSSAKDPRATTPAGIKLQPLHSKYRGFRRGRGGAFFFDDGVD